MTKSLVGLGALTAVLVFAAGAAALLIVNGSIAASDPTQTGSLNRNGVVSACASPKSSPGLLTSVGVRHYDSYTYTNSSGFGECVTVTLTQTSGAGQIFTAAYLGSFNPADPATNYLADPGGSAPPNRVYSFFVPAGQTAVVIVHEVDPDGCIGCTYTVTLGSVTAATFASARLTQTHRGLLLRWRTASEVDLLGFQIYRSRGQSWRRVSHSLITAKGSVAGASYRFLDQTARRHAEFRYRIKAINQDGTESWFGSTLTS